ncbi:MAG: hypothetical protein O7D32_05430, partial [bacterium]|nr:hypothetical protein [bacterium]
MFYDGLLIHTMIIAPNKDLDGVERRPEKGEFLYVGGHGGSHEWLRDANRRLDGRSIVILETHGIGMFGIVRNGNATEKLVPLNLIGANLMSLSKGT